MLSQTSGNFRRPGGLFVLFIPMQSLWKFIQSNSRDEGKAAFRGYFAHAICWGRFWSNQRVNPTLLSSAGVEEFIVIHENSTWDEIFSFNNFSSHQSDLNWTGMSCAYPARSDASPSSPTDPDSCEIFTLSSII